MDLLLSVGRENNVHIGWCNTSGLPGLDQRSQVGAHFRRPGGARVRRVFGIRIGAGSRLGVRWRVRRRGSLSGGWGLRCAGDRGLQMIVAAGRVTIHTVEANGQSGPTFAGTVDQSGKVSASAQVLMTRGIS